MRTRKSIVAGLIGVSGIAAPVLAQSSTCVEAQSAAPVTDGFLRSFTVGPSGFPPTSVCTADDTRDEWFRFDGNAQCETVLTVDTFGTAIGGGDTTLAVFDSCGGSLLACNDDAPGTIDAQASVVVPAGSSVFIRVGAKSSGVTASFRVEAALVDSDSDGVPDCIDPCPNGDDSDGDGVCDMMDVCPGQDDLLDTDGDTVPDCLDSCPDDINVQNLTTGAFFQQLKPAIAAANAGDTLQLGACVFRERDIDLDNKDITIRGRGMGITSIVGGQLSISGGFFRHSSGDSSTIEDVSLRDATNDSIAFISPIFSNESSPTYRRVAFENISDGGSGRPVVQSSRDLDFEIESCVVRLGASEAGQFFRSSEGSARIVNSVFEVSDSIGFGFLVFGPRSAADVVQVVNCTIAGYVGGGAYVSMSGPSPAGAVVIANTVFDSTQPNAVSLGNFASVTTVTGSVHPSLGGDNLATAPVFAGPGSGDYRLAVGSPGIDAGDVAAYEAAGGGFRDIAGNDRLVDDPATETGAALAIDAGAFEFQPSPQSDECPADLALPFGVLDLDDVDAFIQSFLAGCP
ncbi:MAG: thrombospondin type 3 repeat-containing protein [Planctomycetota bacterium]